MKTYEEWYADEKKRREECNNNPIHIDANVLRLKDLDVYGDCRAFQILKRRAARRILNRVLNVLSDARNLEWYCSIDEETGKYHDPYHSEYQGIREIISMILKLHLRMKDYIGID